MRYEDFQFILFDRQPDGVLLATLNRPEVMNATNARLHWELTQLWAVVDNDPTVKVVVVTGAGERAFSAGGDLAFVEEMTGNHAVMSVVMKEASDIVYNMLACEKPIVTAINGVAVGAGLAVALLADVSVMAEGARITDGHARLGVSAGDHAAIVWPLLCGMAKAKYYLLTNRPMTGEEAERNNLVSLAVDAEALEATVLEIAAELAAAAPTAVRMTKHVLNHWLRQNEAIFELSAAFEMVNFSGAEAREAMAAMGERRAPDFKSDVLF